MLLVGTQSTECRDPSLDVTQNCNMGENKRGPCYDGPFPSGTLLLLPFSSGDPVIIAFFLRGLCHDGFK